MHTINLAVSVLRQFTHQNLTRFWCAPIRARRQILSFANVLQKHSCSASCFLCVKVVTRQMFDFFWGTYILSLTCLRLKEEVIAVSKNNCYGVVLLVRSQKRIFSFPRQRSLTTELL